MRFSLTLLLWGFVFLYVHADTLTVKQDGTGDYTYIQNAIGWSSSGDVILVYPGTYYENIDCFGRDSLTIASLFLINPADSNIHNTIINGNQTGNCITAGSGEEDLRIIGLTLTNGSGYGADLGGGILLSYAKASIISCIISNNSAKTGGGAAFLHSDVFLSNTQICNNHAYLTGGGIRNICSTITFDSLNLCDIYLNYAEIGTDYFQTSTCPPNPIILDTATILNPNHYYYACTDDFGFQGCSFEIITYHAKIQAISEDLYVSPSGNDTNNGLSPEYPLKTLSFALLKIKSDSINQNTIHLANGLYSPSDGNKFPIGLKSFTPILGENIENTIIDLNGMTSFGLGNSGENELIIKNFTIKNGVGDSTMVESAILTIYLCDFVLIDSIIIEKCNSYQYSRVLRINGCDSTFIKNSIFRENCAENCLFINGNPFGDSCYTELTSCKIDNNYPGLLQNWGNYGMGLHISNSNGQESIMTAFIINCEINNNSDETTDPEWPATSGAVFEHNTIAHVINSTIGNNNSTNPVSGAVGIAQHSTVSFYNSIIYGNNAHQILMYNTEPDMACEVNLFNSLIENGENGIYNLSPYSTVYYDSTNLAEDPKWISSGDYPYALLNDSPCINAGTQVLPEGIILPDTDLMGGPRISSGEVDIGAYEFLFVGLDENTLAKSEYLKVSPNPFREKLSISFDESLNGKNVELKLYDQKGNLVGSILNGKVKDSIFIWTPGKKDGIIKPGVYFLKCSIDSSITYTIKIIKIS